jgi:putative pyruvate formate lyase activating enzyme
MNDLIIEKISRRKFLKDAVRVCFCAGLPSILFSCTKPEDPGAEAKTAVKEASNKKTGFEPAYLKLHRTGELKKRAEKLWAIMEKCRLCPRRCGANRLEGKKGFCRAPGATLVVSSAHPHYGEEKPLVGKGGSGTIFMTHCNLSPAWQGL